MKRFVPALVAMSVMFAALPLTAGAETPRGSAGDVPVSLSNVASDERPELTYVPGRAVVRYKPRADRSQISSETGMRKLRSLAVGRTDVVTVPSDRSVPDFVAELNARADVAWAEPDYYVETRGAPNDTHFAELWGMDNTGQAVNFITGTADADIDAPEAWDVTTGDPSVLVAVVDDGVDVDHPDLAGRVVPGYDFGDLDDDPRPNPGDFHGTHVTGTMAATGSDSFGVTGVSQQSSILPLKVVDSMGEQTLSMVADALAYAGDQDAHVVNFSLGLSAIPMSWYQAIVEHPNTLYVTAAGNFGIDNDLIPDTCDIWAINLICVGASDQNDAFTDFSHYGPVNVDLAAPGTNVLSTVTYAARLRRQTFSTPIDGRWVTGGTMDDWGIETLLEYGIDGLGETPDTPYKPNVDSWAQLADPIDLSTDSDCIVEWAMSVDTDENHAELLLEASTDGVVWDELGAYGGYDLAYFEESLADYEGESTVFLRWRFVSDAAANVHSYAGILMFDHAVKCSASPYGNSHFDLLDGTSMSSPHVAGAAALLFAHRPGATVEQVRWALLNGVDPLASHAGKTATGGRLNVNEALAILDSAPADPYPDEVTSHDLVADLFGSKKRKKIIFDGYLTPTDGHWACSVSAPVVIQRKAKKWKGVASTVAGIDALFRKKIKYRKGKYRVVIPSGYINEFDYCNEAVSNKVKIK